MIRSGYRNTPLSPCITTRTEVFTLERTQLRTETALFDVRVSEVASPAEKDTILFDGTTYVVQKTPIRRDTRRLIWTLDTRKQ